VIFDDGPSGNATVVRPGRRQLLLAVPVFVMFGVLCWFGLRSVIEGGDPAYWVFLAAGPIGVWAFRRAWRERDDGVAFDATGLWWHRRGEVVPVPWDSLAGIGIRRVGSGRGARHVLQLLLRDGSPAQSIDITFCHLECGSALRRWAPQKLLSGQEPPP
jgi:hypothetical protein